MSKLSLDYLKKRAAEPSTMAGLAAVITGVGQLGKINEASAIADVVANVGVALASGAGWPGALVALLGLAAIFKKESKT